MGRTSPPAERAWNPSGFRLYNRERSIRPDLPAAFERLVNRCLAHDPAGRFADVAELAVALRDLAPERSRPSVERIQRTLKAAAVPLAPVPAALVIGAAPTEQVSGRTAGWAASRTPPAARRSPLFGVGLVVGMLVVGGAAALVATRPPSRAPAAASGGAASGQSAAIRAQGGVPRILSNAISGSGASTGPSYGIFVSTAAATDMSLATGAAILGNSIIAGNGAPSVGISVIGPVTLDLVANSVQAGAATSVSATGNDQLGILLGPDNNGTPQNARVVGNRVYGGGASLPIAGVKSRAMDLNGLKGAVVADNLIYGGYHGQVSSGSVTAGGVELFDCTDAVVAGNTIFTGFASGNVVYDVLFTGTTKGTAVRNDVLAGAGSDEYGVLASDCSAVAALEHNLFVGHNNGTVNAPHCNDAGGGTAADVSKIAQLFPGATVEGNLIMESQCSAGDDGGSCIVNADCAPKGMLDASPGRLATLFPPTWTQTYGMTLWTTSNWALQPDVSCQILHGGLDLSDGGFPYAADYFDAGRGPKPTLGAIESDAGAACP